MNKHETVNHNPSIMIHVNKIKNRITFKLMTGYYLELLMPETMKLLGSTKIEINKDINGENVPRLEIAEVLLIHGNIVDSNHQLNSRGLHTFVPHKSVGQ